MTAFRQKLQGKRQHGGSEELEEIQGGGVSKGNEAGEEGVGRSVGCGSTASSQEEIWALSLFPCLQNGD